MKGHLFEEELEQLHIILNHLDKATELAKKEEVSFRLYHEIAKSTNTLVKTIVDLEESILDYEDGITKDIDRTKAEILQALRRL